MKKIMNDFGFDMDKEDWKHDNNKPHTHGYSKTMNQPRYKELCPCKDLNFACSNQHAVDEALDLIGGLEGTIETISDMNDEWT